MHPSVRSLVKARHRTSIPLTLPLLAAILALLASVSASAGLNRWTTHGPAGDRFDLGVDPTNPDHMALGGFASVYITHDGGQSWSRESRGLEQTEIFSVAFDPQNPSILYAGGYGVFRSTNDGESWQWRADGIHGIPMDVLVVDPIATTTIYVGSEGGLFRSTDSGCSWSPWSSGMTDPLGSPFILDLEIDPSDPSTFYAGLFGGSLFKSTDRGAHWSPMKSGIPYDTVRTITIDTSNPSRLFVAASQGGGDLGPLVSGFFESDNAAGSWHPVFPSLPAGTAWRISIDPGSPSTLYAALGGVGFLKSTDNGITWGTIDDGIDTAFSEGPLRLIVDPRTSTSLLAVEDGVFRSVDGGASWTDLTDSIVSSSMETILLDPSAPSTVYTGSERGLFRSLDAGGSWELISSPAEPESPELLGAAATNPTTLYATSFVSFGLYRSIDAGAHWQELFEDGSSTPFPHTVRVLVDPGDPGHIYAVSRYGIFESGDGGDSWSSPTPNPSSNGLSDMVVEWGNPDVFYGSDGYSVFRSPDSGQTWADISDGLSPAIVQKLAQDPADDSRLLAGTQLGVYVKSGDASWQPIGTGLPDTNITWLTADPAQPGRFYAACSAKDLSLSAMENGLFVTHDSGSTWARFGDGLEKSNGVEFVVTDPAGEFVHAASIGVYDYQISSPPPPLITGIAPQTGPPAGGTSVTISGVGFQMGAQVLVGGSAAGGVDVLSPTTIVATTPDGIPGGADIVVVNVDTQQTTVRGGYVYDFADVPPGSPFYDQIVRLASAGVTKGCGAGDFCPSGNVSRAQVAALLERAIHGPDFYYSPPSQIFTDVHACTSLAAEISQLWRDALTAGCGNGDFCPAGLVPRAQMALFIGRAIAPAATPPSAYSDGGTGRSYDCSVASPFTDVAANTDSCNAIGYIWARGIVDGFGNGTFGPNDALTRAPTAKFIANAFGLMLGP